MERIFISATVGGIHSKSLCLLGRDRAFAAAEKVDFRAAESQILSV